MSGKTWRIRLVEGQGAPSELVLEPGRPRVVGRGDGVDLRLDDLRVSGRHLQLAVEASGIELTDLGSSGGTRVDGKRLAKAQLAGGERIQVGACMLVVEDAAGAASVPPPREALLAALAGLLGESEAGVEERLGPVLEKLVSALGVDRGVVLVPGTGDKLEVLCTRLRPGTGGAPDEGISRRLVARVAAERIPQLLTSLETEELRQELKSISGAVRSILAVPLPLPGSAGVLYLDSAFERRRLEPSDRDLVAVFAEAAGRAVAREAERHEAQGRSRRLAELLRRSRDPSELIGTSPAMARTKEEIARAAPSDVTVLVTGASGTGKELVARALHDQSPRADQAFVAVNCGAIPAELVESELFGHEKGAFSGAGERRAGHFELASGGTLFLDEVGELPAAAQTKLLRALEERTIVRVGGGTPVKVDFRLVAATNVDLEDSVKAGKFRKDLYFRLAVFRIRLPELAARGADVLTLAEHFLARACRAYRRPLDGFSPEARAALAAHPWPGNVRELRNAVEQAVLREDSAHLTPASLFPSGQIPLRPAAGSPAVASAVELAPEVEGGSLEEARRRFEKRFIEARLAEQKGNMKATAEAIGLSRAALYAKCQDLGIEASKFR